MESTVNLFRVRPGTVAGYPGHYVGDGWVERFKGSLVRDRQLQATVVLGDDDVRKAIDWILENRHAYPFSFTDNNRVVGVEIGESDLVQTGQPR